MAYDINWFEKNMIAIPAGPFGNCSACCFRNLDAFCNKIECSDLNKGICVYWETKVPGQNREVLMGQPSKQMQEWFAETSLERAQNITGAIINKALQNQKQNVK